jgi:hypothetical protein
MSLLSLISCSLENPFDTNSKNYIEEETLRDHIGADSLYIIEIDTLIRIDTLIIDSTTTIYDTTFIIITDTVQITKTVRDTVTINTHTTDSIRITDSLYISDSIIIFDTTLLIDTLRLTDTLQITDTLKIKDTITVTIRDTVLIKDSSQVANVPVIQEVTISYAGQYEEELRFHYAPRVKVYAGLHDFVRYIFIEKRYIMPDCNKFDIIQTLNFDDNLPIYSGAYNNGRIAWEFEELPMGDYNFSTNARCTSPDTSQWSGWKTIYLQVVDRFGRPL